MPLIIDMSDDIYYLQGQEIGLEKGREEGLEKGLKKGQLIAKYTFVVNLLEDDNFTQSQIVKIADTTPAFVKKVERELAKQSEVLALLKLCTKDDKLSNKAGVSVEYFEYLLQQLKKKRKS